MTPEIPGHFATVTEVHMFLISNKRGGTPKSEFNFGTISWLLLPSALDCQNVPQQLADNGALNLQESPLARAATFQCHKFTKAVLMKIFRNKRFSRRATGWTVQLSNPDVVEIFCPCTDLRKIHQVLYNEPGLSR